MRMNPHPEDKDKARLPRCLSQSRSAPGVRAENASPKGNFPGFLSSFSLNPGKVFAGGPGASDSTHRRKLTLSLPAQTINLSSSTPVRRHSTRSDGSQSSSGLLDRGDGTKGAADRSTPQMHQQSSLPHKHQPVDPLEAQVNKLKKERHLNVQTPVCLQHPNPSDPKPLSFSRDRKPLAFLHQPQCSLHTRRDSHSSSMEAFEDMRWYEIPLTSPRKHESGLFSKKFQSSLEEYRRQREMRKKRKGSHDALCTCMLKPAIVRVERLPQQKILAETKCKGSKDVDVNKTDFISPTQGAVKFSKALPKQLSSSERALADSATSPVKRYRYCSNASCYSETFSPSKRVTERSISSESKKRQKEPISVPALMPTTQPLSRDSPGPQLQDWPLLPPLEFHFDTDIKKAHSSCDNVQGYLDTSASNFSQASDDSEDMFPLDWSPPRIDFLYQTALPDSRPLIPGNIVDPVKAKDGVLAGLREIEGQIAVACEGSHPTSHDTDSCAGEELILLKVTMLEDFVVNESVQSAEEAASPSQKGRPSKRLLETGELPSRITEAEVESPMAMDSMEGYSPLRFAKPPKEQSVTVSGNAVSHSPEVLGWNRESPASEWDCREQQDKGVVKLDDLLQPMKSIEECTLQTATPKPATCQDMHSLSLMSSSYQRWFVPPVTAVSEDYTNSLDYLLQEKHQGEHVVLEEELEKSLNECLLLGQGFDRSSNSEVSGEETSLMEEHRLFIQRYSVSTGGFPSSHPGEDIFTQPLNLHLWKQSSSFALDTTELHSRHTLEHLLFSSRPSQQLSFIRDGFLSFLYRCLPCPKPVLRWLFQLLAAPPEVSTDSFKALWDISMDGMLKSEEAPEYMWCPSMQEIVTVFQSLGARPSVLHPGEILQAEWIPGAGCMPLLLNSETQSTDRDRSTQGAAAGIPLSTNLSHVFKFLTLCGAARPRWYKDCEILALVRILCKTSLDRALRNQPKEDLQQLLAALLDNIRLWEKKLPDLCLCLSQLSNHHHNLLSIVQHIPDISVRGRQLQRLLSLIVIAKLLGGKPQVRCWMEGEQLQTLCRFFSSMKPSSLKQRLAQAGRAEEAQLMEEHLERPSDLDHEVYYLCHSLLMLANVVVGTEALPSDRWNDLHALCIQLDRQITSNIRENPQYMYRSRLKDLAVHTHVKWQELLVQGRQQKLYACWAVAPLPSIQLRDTATLPLMRDNEEDPAATGPRR